MLVVQPCPSPFDVEIPVHDEIKFMFGKAIAKHLGPAMKRQDDISYWWAELDGIPIWMRMTQEGRCFVTYDKNDTHNLNQRLNVWLTANIMPVVKEVEPKVIRQPHK